MRIKSVWFVLSFVFACRGEEIRPKSLLADEWEVTQVSYDGVEQLEWQGLSFVFEQTSDSAGFYHLPATPYDTVWPASGTWRLNALKHSLTFDEKFDATYHVSADDLEIMAYLPWTKQSYCYGEICLPMVSGDWIFNLRRKK